MPEVDQVSSLIGDIYDAALDPTLWPRVLEKTAHFVGGHGAGICLRDAGRKAGNVSHEVGTDRRYAQSYFGKYIDFDPMSASYVGLDVGEVFIYSDLVPPPEFAETRFYQEWVEPQGWIDTAFVTLEKSRTSFSCFNVFYREGDALADGSARERLQAVVPHLRRAAMIGAAMKHKTAEAASLADTLDGLSAGMFLVDAGGRMVHANASGHALLDQRSVLRAGSGKVAAVEPGAERELDQIFALTAGGDAAIGGKGISVPLMARAGEHYVAHMLPLTAGEGRRAGKSYGAVAALFVHKAEFDAPAPPEAIARHYKLTPTELRVLLGIVQLGGVPEVADALGIGEATVKTHLHRLFAKTETRRQADLVKLVAAFSNPLVG